MEEVDSGIRLRFLLDATVAEIRANDLGPTRKKGAMNVGARAANLSPAAKKVEVDERASDIEWGARADGERSRSAGAERRCGRI